MQQQINPESSGGLEIIKVDFVFTLQPDMGQGVLPPRERLSKSKPLHLGTSAISDFFSLILKMKERLERNENSSEFNTFFFPENSAA